MSIRARSFAFQIATFLTVTVLNGCGGGGASAPAVGMAPAPAAATAVPGAPKPSSSPAATAMSTTANITFAIPAVNQSIATSRRSQYVSSATNSAGFTVSGATTVIQLTATSPNCNVAASGARNCSIVFPAPSGANVPFVVSTFASSDGSGTPLSTVHSSQTIVLGQANTINVTLDAVVTRINVSVGATSFTIGTPATATVIVTPLDAAGKIIALGSSNLVDVNDAPITLSLRNSETAATQLSTTTIGTSPITLSYSGGTPNAGDAIVTASAASTASGVVTTSAATVPFQSAPSAPNGAQLPPFGVYTSCEIDTNLANCEAEDLKMTQYGLTMEINYLSTAAHKTGSNSLQAWAQYDASIGIMQWINLKEVLNESDALTGTYLTGGSLGHDCGSKTNQEVIQCIDTVLSAVPGFRYGYYIYDEPGCPEPIGYCYASLSAGHYKNIEELATFLQSVSTHPVLGIQVGGVGTNIGNQDMFTCNNACGGSYYMSGPHSPNTGGDDYPVSGDPVATKAGLINVGQAVKSIVEVLAGPTSGNTAETMSWVVQAFSWLQEAAPGAFNCTSMINCPMITQTQLQEQRDEALYYAGAAGKPIQYFFWYYWPDINCHGSFNTVNGLTPMCDAQTNLNALKAADQASFPSAPPTIQ